MNRFAALGIVAAAFALGLVWQSAAIRGPVRVEARADPRRHPVRLAVRLNPRGAPPAEPPGGDERANPLAATIAEIHAELGFWNANVTGDIRNKDAEAAASRRWRELEALLTDDNCAAIVCELSVQELQSPIGLAALRRWLALEPTAAARAIALRPDATDDLAFLVADTLIEHPADLLELWRESPNSNWTQKMLQHAAGAAVTIEPRAALDLAEHVTDPEIRAALLPQIVNHWVQHEPAAAMAWVANLPDSSTREALVTAAALARATADPAQAAEWLLRGVSDRDALQGALKELVGAWGADDIEAAAKWADAIADPELRSTALKIVSNCRTQRASDPADASL